MDRTIQIDDPPALLHDAVQHPSQQFRRIRPAPFFAGVRKPFANIALPCRSKQSVDHGVKKHIGVAVTIETEVGVSDVNATNDQRPAADRAMSVMAFADSEFLIHLSPVMSQRLEKSNSCCSVGFSRHCNVCEEVKGTSVG